MLDDLDRRILRVWQQNPEIAHAVLADRLSMSLGRLDRRIEHLKSTKTIRARHTLVDWSRFGFHVRVFLRVSLDKTHPNAWGVFLEAARKIPEIVVIESLLGKVDVRMDVRAYDLEHYREIYVQKILPLPHLSDVEALLLISEIKNTPNPPV